MQSEKSTSVTSGAPSARTLLKSTAYHGAALAFVMLVPIGAIRRSAQAQELEVTFYRPVPRVEVPAPSVVKLPAGEKAVALPRPERAAPPGPPNVPPGPPPTAPGGPLEPETPGSPPGPEGSPIAEAPPQEKPGKPGLLAFKDQFASLAQDKKSPRLGADARITAPEDLPASSSRITIPVGAPGASGGVNLDSLSRNVGGGHGTGDGTGGPPGMPGVPLGRVTSGISPIGGGGGTGGGGNGAGGGGGGGGRPGAGGGLGPSRTDEEIQIVFDRYKASFYRLYHRELRKDATLSGQMVLRLTIEPDGSVSMCVLQSTDMNAPELGAQVVDRVKTINFGAKEGVQAVTIVYPIDFLPSEAGD